MEASIPLGLVHDESRKDVPLTMEDEVIKVFLKSDAYSSVRGDRELFDYFYHETSNASTGWIEYSSEPDKKIKYKYEEGQPFVTCMSECIVKAPMTHVLCLFAEIDIFADWFP